MKDHLLKYRNPDNNILNISLPELQKLGYKQRSFVSTGAREVPHSQPKDLLCGVNKEKDLWIVLDEKSAKNIDPNKFIVYFKD